MQIFSASLSVPLSTLASHAGSRVLPARAGWHFAPRRATSLLQPSRPTQGHACCPRAQTGPGLFRVAHPARPAPRERLPSSPRLLGEGGEEWIGPCHPLPFPGPNNGSQAPHAAACDACPQPACIPQATNRLPAQQSGPARLRTSVCQPTTLNPGRRVPTYEPPASSGRCCVNPRGVGGVNTAPSSSPTR